MELMCTADIGFYQMHWQTFASHYTEDEQQSNLTNFLRKMRQAEVQYNGCQNFKDIMEFYRNRSAYYDQIMEKVHDRSPATVASLLLDNGAKLEERVLDAAAGTGATGMQLKNLGYKNVDALEPCQEMADIARKRNIYQQIYNCSLGEGEFTIPDDSYDHATMAGALCPSHVKLEGLKDLCRAVKAGGLVVFNIREDYTTKVDMYRHLPEVMSNMEEEGWWTPQIKILLQYDDDFMAYYYVCQVKKTSHKNQFSI